MKTGRLLKAYKRDLRRLAKAARRVTRWPWVPASIEARPPAEIVRPPAEPVEVRFPPLVEVQLPPLVEVRLPELVEVRFSVTGSTNDPDPDPPQKPSRNTFSINSSTGWMLMVMSFVLVAMTDPVFFRETDPAELKSSFFFGLFYSQPMKICMALFQLILARITEEYRDDKDYRGDDWTLGLAQWMTAGGGVIYLVSSFISQSIHRMAARPSPYLVQIKWIDWLTPVASLIVFIGTLMFIRIVSLARKSVAQRVLIVISLSFLIDTLVHVLMLHPGMHHPESLPAWLKDLAQADSYSNMLLRFGRAATIAMPILALLYTDLLPYKHHRGKWFHIGQHAILFGSAMLGMGLTASALITPWIVNITLFAVLALWLGIVVATCFAWKHGRPLQIFGWVCVATSVTVGLGMGLYAFKSIFQIPVSPERFGDYLYIGRRFARTGHVYLTVLGIVCVYIASELNRKHAKAPLYAWTLVATILFMEAMLWLVYRYELPTDLLALGPIAVAFALMPFATRAWEGDPGNARVQEWRHDSLRG